MDAEIPEKFEPSSWYKEKIEGLERELEKVKRIGPLTAQTCAKEDYEQQVAAHQKYISNMKDDMSKYKAMYAKIVKWKPPTDDHIHLKKFMIDQINSSIAHDCDIQYHVEKIKELRPLTGAQWKKQRVKKIEENIKYCEEKYAEEVERAAWRTQWITELRKSL